MDEPKEATLAQDRHPHYEPRVGLLAKPNNTAQKLKST